MSKQFLAILAAIVIIFVGVIVVSNNKSNNSSSSKSSGTPSQHVEGVGQAQVTLVEYGDYECPYCGEAFPVIKQAAADLNQQIYFQFRNFPLISLHPNAFAGARAAEAASLQGKFWQMHDLLYENQNSWANASDPTPYFNQYAQQLGLNVTKFKQDFSSSQVNNTINADMAAGNKLNITGTPAFYLDGKQVTLPYTSGAAAVEQIIKTEIAKKTGSTATTSSSSSTQTTQPATAQ